jgi:hypothetical protein
MSGNMAIFLKDAFIAPARYQMTIYGISGWDAKRLASLTM